jgi:hypothetical protein
MRPPVGEWNQCTCSQRNREYQIRANLETILMVDAATPSEASQIANFWYFRENRPPQLCQHLWAEGVSHP